MILYCLAFLTSLVLSLLATPLVERMAIRLGATDDPTESARKIHSKVIPRAGGVVFFTLFFIISMALLPTRPATFGGLVLACLLVFCVGLWDDFSRVSPWTKLAVQLLAACIAVIGFGIRVDVISNPFGQQWNLLANTWQVGSLYIPIASVLFSVLWLVGMTNTINFLDGLDGLATGITGVAAFILFCVALLPRINQPDTAIMAIILLGLCLGFLRSNFHPATIFLGDSGAYFLGMLLGILSIISGAKLATALLVLGVPVLDAVWAVVRRLATGRSPFSADRGHIHHLLLDVGLSQPQAVILLYLLALVFGGVALLGDSQAKVIALTALLTLVILGVGTLLYIRRRRRATS